MLRSLKGSVVNDGNRAGPPRGTQEFSDQGQSHEAIVYELCNVFGTPTGRRITVARGEVLPPVPKGWSWQPVTS